MRCRVSILLALLFLVPITSGIVSAISPAPDESHPYISEITITQSDDLNWIDNASIVSDNGRHLMSGSLTGSFNAGGEIISKTNGEGVIVENLAGTWSNPIQLPFTPDVVIPSSSSVLVHGVFNTSLSLGQTNLTAEGPALFFAAMDHDSGLLWSHVIEDQGPNPELFDLVPTSDGGVIAIGEFSHERSLQGNQLFSPNGQSTGSISSAREIMAFKVTQNGTITWSDTFGSDLSETVLSTFSTDHGAALLVRHTSSFSGSAPSTRNATFDQHNVTSDEDVIALIIDSENGTIDSFPWTMTNVTHLTSHPLGFLGIGQGTASNLGCTDERSSMPQNGDDSLTWFTVLFDDSGQCLWSNHVIGYVPFEMVDVAVTDNGLSFLILNIGEPGQDHLPKTTTLNDVTITLSKGRDTVILSLESDGRWSSSLHIGDSITDDVGIGVTNLDNDTLLFHVDAAITVSGASYVGEQLLLATLTFEKPEFEIVFQREGNPLETTTWSSGPVDLLITSTNYSGVLTITSNLSQTIWSTQYVADGDQAIVTAEFPFGIQDICVLTEYTSPTCISVVHEPEPFWFNPLTYTLFPSGDGGLLLTFTFISSSNVQIDPGEFDGDTSYTIESTTLNRYLVNVSYLIFSEGSSDFCVTASIESHSPITQCENITIQSSLLDSDVDGVADSDDICPNTSESERSIVSPVGCSSAQLAALDSATSSNDTTTTQTTSSPTAKYDSGSTPLLMIILVLLAAVAVVVVSSAPVVIQILKDLGEHFPEQYEEE